MSERARGREGGREGERERERERERESIFIFKFKFQRADWELTLVARGITLVAREVDPSSNHGQLIRV